MDQTTGQERKYLNNNYHPITLLMNNNLDQTPNCGDPKNGETKKRKRDASEHRITGGKSKLIPISR